MSAPRTYKTEAVILKHVDLGEADRIVTLYSPGYGKIRAVARGVRKMKSRLGGHTEPLTRCTMMIARGRNLDVISQSQVIDSYLSIHNDLQLAARGMYFAELIDAFTSEHIENYPIYTLVIDTLNHLPKARSIELLFRYFEIQLLGYLGYRPQLYECVNCRIPLDPVENFFSPSGGGILCPGCAHSELEVRTVSVDAVKVLRLFQKDDYLTASRLRMNQYLSRELREILRAYLRYLLERDINTTRFLSLLEQDNMTSFG